MVKPPSEVGVKVAVGPEGVGVKVAVLLEPPTVIMGLVGVLLQETSCMNNTGRTKIEIINKNFFIIPPKADGVATPVIVHPLGDNFTEGRPLKIKAF